MNIRQSYDLVADEYVRRIADELRHKPFDRALLDRVASEAGDGPICDVGCGPGHIARYLHEQGSSVCGIDLSDAMVERARQLNPGIEFRQGDMMALPVPDGSFSAVVAFYSLIHIPQSEMRMVLQELHRVLKPGGLLLAAFHLGTQTLHLDRWWELPVDVDFHFYQTAEMQAWMEAAGFEIEMSTERDPYPEIEHQSRRAYIFARRPPIGA